MPTQGNDPNAGWSQAGNESTGCGRKAREVTDRWLLAAQARIGQATSSSTTQLMAVVGNWPSAPRGPRSGR